MMRNPFLKLLPLLLAAVATGEVQVDSVLDAVFVRAAERTAAIRDATYIGAYLYREFDSEGNQLREETCRRRVYTKGYGNQHLEFLDVRVNGKELAGRARSVQIALLKQKGLVQDEAAMPFRLETMDSYNYELLGSDTLGGREVWVVGFDPLHRSMKTVTGQALVDKATFDILQLRFKPAWLPWVCVGTCMTLYLRELDGYTYPYFFEMDMTIRVKVLITLAHRRLRVEDRFTDYQFNTGLPDSLFD